MTSAERRREMISIFEAIRSACDKGYRLNPEALADRIEAMFAETEGAAS